MNIINNYSTTIVSIFQDVINNYERNLEIIKQAEDRASDQLAFDMDDPFKGN